MHSLLSMHNFLSLFRRKTAMNAELENYYMKHPEPFSGCLLALKQMIMSISDQVTHERKYQVPFFYYKGKKLGFLWMNKKKLILGFVTDKSILSPVEGIKLKDHLELIEIDPNADLPKEMIVAKLMGLIGRYEKSPA
jgi:hypothetical protein